MDAMTRSNWRDAGPPWLVLVAIATVLAIGLRTWGLTGQVVLDDEWHAIHKLATSSYWDIFRTFGVADHSIPLTLFYKAMADTIGLAEGRLRALQAICGIALVPAGAWLAWRATGDRPASALFAFLVAGSPFLVMWSRFARPYAITVLLSVLCVAAVWRWRTQRTWRWAAAAAVTGALAAWFHTIAGMYAAIACLFVFAEDVLASRREGLPASRSPRVKASFRLGVRVAASMALLLAAPMVHDFHSLAEKGGGDRANLDTFAWMVAIVWGGVPTTVIAAACLVAAWGFVVLLRRDRPLAAYLAALGAVPMAFLSITGAVWIFSGQNFLRYQLPFLPLVLFLGSVGTTDLARAIVRSRPERAAWSAALGLSAAYLAATPAIAQVATLGPWYAHLDYHWDYRHRWNETKRPDHSYDPPEFYRRLGRMAPGAAPVIEAPFEWEAPYEQLAYYARFHRQHELFGMLHDLCRDGPRVGEPPPRDRRFRFRLFVFLDDVDGVRNTGARYLLLHLNMPHGKPFPEAGRCLERLTALYGAPAEQDDRLAVFELRPGAPPPKLQ